MSSAKSDDISVVIVDDEEDLVTLYESFLLEESDVTTATSGKEALDVIDESVDVVFLDRHMPEMTGDEVLSELRERGYDMPVAMLTGIEPDVDIIDMPFDDYLTKPVDRESLVQAVRVLANRASFEETSRKFFQLAAKKDSLDATESVQPDEEAQYNELISRMTDLQTTLDETIETLVEADLSVVSRTEPDQVEIETLLTAVNDHTLPEDLRALLEDYHELHAARPPFMWKWVHRLAPQNTLPCVDQEYQDRVPIDKTITILFITLLDDILEKTQDRATYAELSKIPFKNKHADPDRDDVNSAYVRYGKRVWTRLEERIQRAPHFDTYEELFRFDIDRGIDSIDYSDIAIRRPDLSTLSDLERYESHNMVMFAYADIDLMHSSIDVRDELATIRDAIWTAQLMARIGNWVSTWERELAHGDYSSGPVVYALEEDIITPEELQERTDDEDSSTALIDRIKESGVETEFLRRWEQHYHELRKFDEELTSMDLDPFIAGTEEVLRYHLASRGLK